jgi:hypothetical protein
MPDQMPQVTKGYETYSAQELVKVRVVMWINQISDLAGRTRQMKYIGRSDPMTEYQFRSEVLEFYRYLRPKIVEFIGRANTNNIDRETYKKFINSMDWFERHFKRFSTDGATVAFSNLNQFCEQYKLTSTIYYSGTAYKTTGSSDMFNA